MTFDLEPRPFPGDIESFRDEAGGELPIPEYDVLRIEEILERLPSIPKDRVVELIEHEVARKHRKTLLDAFEDAREDVPIENYHRLTAREIVRRLRVMPRDQVRRLRRHEHRHKARQTILEAIDRRLDAEM